MGHDITAIKDYTEYQKFWKNPNLDFSKTDMFRIKSEIAYLRRSAWSNTIHELYKFLCFGSVNGGCSGDGSFVIVDIDTLKEAKEKVINAHFKEDEKDYLKFLNKCITYCKDNDKEGVIIHFG